MNSLKEDYVQLICDRLSVCKEDLTITEIEIINVSFGLIEEKLEDLKILNDEVKRLVNENLNLKAYADNSDSGYDDDED